MNIVSIDKTDWNTELLVHWKVSDVCNYNCSYCEPTNHKTIDIKNINSADKLISGLGVIYHAAQGKTVQIILTGGEPFLIPQVEKFLAKIQEYQFRLVIFTNGSMPLKIYQRCLPYLKEPNVVCISFHPETADIDSLVAVAKLFKENNERMEIRGMLASGFTEKVEELADKLQREDNIGINRLVVYPLVNKKTGEINRTGTSSRELTDYTQDSSALERYYSQEELDYISNLEEQRKQNKDKKNKKNFAVVVKHKQQDEIIEQSASAYSIVMKNLNNFRGWRCGIAKKKVAIDPDGNVRFGICNSYGKIVGNIFQQGFNFIDDDITCRLDRCMTIDEIMVSKYNPLEILIK